MVESKRQLLEDMNKRTGLTEGQIALKERLREELALQLIFWWGRLDGEFFEAAGVAHLHPELEEAYMREGIGLRGTLEQSLLEKDKFSSGSGEGAGTAAATAAPAAAARPRRADGGPALEEINARNLEEAMQYFADATEQRDPGGDKTPSGVSAPGVFEDLIATEVRRLAEREDAAERALAASQVKKLRSEYMSARKKATEHKGNSSLNAAYHEKKRQYKRAKKEAAPKEFGFHEEMSLPPGWHTGQISSGRPYFFTMEDPEKILWSPPGVVTEEDQALLEEMPDLQVAEDQALLEGDPDPSK